MRYKRNRSNQYPIECRLNPWPHSVCRGSGVAMICGWCRSQAWLGSHVAVAESCSSNSIPSLGTSICLQCGSKKQREGEETLLTSYLLFQFLAFCNSQKFLTFPQKLSLLSIILDPFPHLPPPILPQRAFQTDLSLSHTHTHTHSCCPCPWRNNSVFPGTRLL